MDILKELLFNFMILVNQIQLYTSTSVYRFKRQVTSGSLEVISIPAYFYPNISHAAGSTDDSEKLERYDILKSGIPK